MQNRIPRFSFSKRWSFNNNPQTNPAEEHAGEPRSGARPQNRLNKVTTGRVSGAEGGG